MNVKIGAKIKALRKRDDITQERLAEVLGVTNQAISRWESESGYPDIEYIMPIANFFNVTVDYLFDHDLAGKRRKIDEYCEQFDVHRRSHSLPQERIEMMRQALAEFPAEEQLLFRLAKALYHKWCSYGIHSHMIDGYIIADFEKHQSFDSWEESVKIMEELLATSLDDSIRSECRELLAYIYGKIGEKEKVLTIAEKCDDMSHSKQAILANAIWDEDAVMYKQKYFISLLCTFRYQFMYLANCIGDKNVINEAYNITINLFKFIFSDGNYGFYNDSVAYLYQAYAWELIRQDKIDEAFEAFEKAVNHFSAFDMYLKELRKKGVMKYTSLFINLTEDDINDVTAADQLPQFLKNFKEEIEEGVHYKKIYSDPKYETLINKIEADIAKR